VDETGFQYCSMYVTVNLKGKSINLMNLIPQILVIDRRMREDLFRRFPSAFSSNKLTDSTEQSTC
jgi:hypothetical protein